MATSFWSFALTVAPALDATLKLGELAYVLPAPTQNMLIVIPPT
jgi:hypothetical protein